MASRTSMLTAFLLKNHPDKFMGKTGGLRPGEQYLMVPGGLSEDGPVKIEFKSKREFRKLAIPHDKIKYYLPGADNSKKEDQQLIEAAKKQLKSLETIKSSTKLFKVICYSICLVGCSH